MSLSTRLRRPQPSDPSASSSPSSSYSKVDKQGKSGDADGFDKGFRWFFPLVALGMLRYMSATSNIIHDCDEVFNYWEPLHYLLYKSGFQTWEYRYPFNCFWNFSFSEVEILFISFVLVSGFGLFLLFGFYFILFLANFLFLVYRKLLGSAFVSGFNLLGNLVFCYSKLALQLMNRLQPSYGINVISFLIALL